MRIVKTTPVLFVEHIEPLLAFWRERLGYTQIVEVPHGDEIGFVILQRDGSEIMLQSRDSVAEDLPKAAGEGCVLFHEVEGLDEVTKAMRGITVVAGPRETPYGMRELWVRDAGGTVHGFAQKM